MLHAKALSKRRAILCPALRRAPNPILNLVRLSISTQIEILIFAKILTKILVLSLHLVPILKLGPIQIGNLHLVPILNLGPIQIGNPRPIQIGKLRLIVNPKETNRKARPELESWTR